MASAQKIYRHEVSSSSSSFYYTVKDVKVIRSTAFEFTEFEISSTTLSFGRKFTSFLNASFRYKSQSSMKKTLMWCGVSFIDERFD